MQKADTPFKIIVKPQFYVVSASRRP